MSGTDPMKLLVSIVDHGRGKFIKRFSEENNIYFSFRLHGDGTASSDLLELLGLDGAEKDIIVNLLPSRYVPIVIRSISNLMSMGSPGKGIAFAVPLSALNALADREIRDLMPELDEKATANGGDLVNFSLIMAVYNAGFTDEMVAAARSAGATGGTVLHARGIAKEQGEKFFGLTIQDEKEVILILTPSDMRSGIIDALNHTCGPNTDICALVMALPVTDVAGLG